MRKIAITIFSCVTGFIALAQQDPQFSQNMFNRLSTNAGYAGTNKAICANSINRLQWLNFPGAPKTFLLSADMPILSGTPFNGGAGITVAIDQLGYESNLALKGAYSYHLNLGTGTLGLGLEVGMLQKSIDGSQWIAPDGSTSASGISDAAIPGSVSSTTYDVGFGAYYTGSQGLFIGLSSTHLPQTTLSAASFNYVNVRHYYLTGGYTIPLPSNPSIEFKPSVFVKSDGRTAQIDANCLVEYNNQYWGGVSFRAQDAIAPMVGMNYGLANGSNLRFGYAYDVTYSKIQKDGHELFLGYCFNVSFPDKKESYQNPRYFY